MQELLKGFVILKCLKHPAKDQQHRQWRTILGEVEGLQTNFTHTINPKARQDMNDVMGFFEAVDNEFLVTGNGRWINQRLGCDAL